MTATVSDLANGTSITANTTVVTGGTVTASVGDGLVTIAASSNDGSGGAASQSDVVDSDAVNVHTQRQLTNYDPGAAGAGATLGMYSCVVTQALSGDTITVNHSVNTSEKAVEVYKIVPGASEVVSFLAAASSGNTGNATAHAAPSCGPSTGANLQSGDIVFAAAAIETDDAVSGDSDTLDGSWNAIITRLADNGADASTMSCSSQYKIVTGTSTQDWTCTTVSARDSARAWIVMRSAVPAARSIGSNIIEGPQLRRPMIVGPNFARRPSGLYMPIRMRRVGRLTLVSTAFVYRGRSMPLRQFIQRMEQASPRRLAA